MKTETKEVLAKAAKEFGWGVARLFGEKLVETASKGRVELGGKVKDHTLGDSNGPMRIGSGKIDSN